MLKPKDQKKDKDEQKEKKTEAKTSEEKKPCKESKQEPRTNANPPNHQKKQKSTDMEEGYVSQGTVKSTISTEAVNISVDPKILKGQHARCDCKEQIKC
jgi:sRNA-binding protein